MFRENKETLEKAGAAFTVGEIAGQGELWRETLNRYKEKRGEIAHFLEKVCSGTKEVRVVFTGAGTSAYVGNIAQRYLRTEGDKRFTYESIPTTDLVAAPHNFIDDTKKTLLVSFARSGNSPESLYSASLAEKCMKDVFHLAITCAKEGSLSQNLENKENAYVFLMDERTNDKGFAMTSSFTCMLLAAVLIFDDAHNTDEKENQVRLAAKYANKIMDREDEIKKIIDRPFSRIVYLGSSLLYAFTQEAALKILELTAGKIAALYESSMGFRHGPKSFVDENTLVFCFLSDNPYTRLYDIDILNEISNDAVARETVAVGFGKIEGKFSKFIIDEEESIEDIFAVLPFAFFAQTLAVMTSLKIANTPDTPSKSGTVNRVVKGVILHEYENGK